MTKSQTIPKYLSSSDLDETFIVFYILFNIVFDC